MSPGFANAAGRVCNSGAIDEDYTEPIWSKKTLATQSSPDDNAEMQNGQAGRLAEHPCPLSQIISKEMNTPCQSCFAHVLHIYMPL